MVRARREPCGLAGARDDPRRGPGVGPRVLGPPGADRVELRPAALGVLGQPEDEREHVAREVPALLAPGRRRDGARVRREDLAANVVSPEVLVHRLEGLLLEVLELRGRQPALDVRQRHEGVHRAPLRGRRRRLAREREHLRVAAAPLPAEQRQPLHVRGQVGRVARDGGAEPGLLLVLVDAHADRGHQAQRERRRVGRVELGRGHEVLVGLRAEELERLHGVGGHRAGPPRPPRLLRGAEGVVRPQEPRDRAPRRRLDPAVERLPRDGAGQRADEEPALGPVGRRLEPLLRAAPVAAPELVAQRVHRLVDVGRVLVARAGPAPLLPADHVLPEQEDRPADHAGDREHDPGGRLLAWALPLSLREPGRREAQQERQGGQEQPDVRQAGGSSWRCPLHGWCLGSRGAKLP